MFDHINSEVEENVDEEEFDSSDMESPLAKEFAAHCKSVGEQIEAKLDEAHKALREAEEIAEKHGVPFSSGISPLSNSYVPGGFSKTKFSKLDTEVVCEIAGVWGEYISDMFGYGGGWLHSAVCN